MSTIFDEIRFRIGIGKPEHVVIKALPAVKLAGQWRRDLLQGFDSPNGDTSITIRFDYGGLGEGYQHP